MNTASYMVSNMNKTQNNGFSGTGPSGPVTPSLNDKYHSLGAINNSNFTSNGISGKRNFEPTP